MLTGPRSGGGAHRAGHGMERIWLSEDFRQRIATEPGAWTQRSMLAPPTDTDRGLWLATDHLFFRGLVRDFGAEHLVVDAPACGSWLRAEPVGRSSWNVTTHGPRDIWNELQDLAARWRAAGGPHRRAPRPDSRHPCSQRTPAVPWVRSWAALLQPIRS
ncbi:hypothetical protein ACWGRV_29280 [Streptomyces sp. NPDC055663]